MNKSRKNLNKSKVLNAVYVFLNRLEGFLWNPEGFLWNPGGRISLWT